MIDYSSVVSIPCIYPTMHTCIYKYIYTHTTIYTGIWSTDMVKYIGIRLHGDLERGLVFFPFLFFFSDFTFYSLSVSILFSFHIILVVTIIFFFVYFSFSFSMYQWVFCYFRSAVHGINYNISAIDIHKLMYRIQIVYS